MMKSLIIFLFIAFQLPSMLIPCQYISNWNPQTYHLSQRETIVSTRYGFDMIIDSEDKTVSTSIQQKGVWQSQLMHVIALFVEKGSKVLNLGSQTGLQAVFLGRLIGQTGLLYVFQPYSVSYAILKKNIYLNDLQKISRIFQAGAADFQGSAQILVSSQNTGGAQIFLSNIPFYSKERAIISEKVEIDLIDNMIDNEVTFDFVLMDVEKMEVEALMGMKQLITRSPNVKMLLEWQYSANSKRNEGKTLHLLNWLTQKGFKFYRYHEDQLNKCSIGKFQLIADMKSMLSLPVQDILILPEHINPNKML